VPVEQPVATVQAVAGAHAEATEQVAEAASVTAQATDAAASPAAEFATEAADISAEDADEAVLGMIAAEMAAYDPSDEDGESDIDGYETQLADSPAVEPEIIATTAEEASWETSERAAGETLVAPEIAPAIEPAAPPPQPEPEPSLGSTLIANGLLRKPATAASDPLAAIRRLSQIEKIALFS
jgi:hypothetical protein